MQKRIRVIINPAAGQPQPVLATLNAVFHPLRVHWEVAVTLQAGDAARFAQQALADKVDVIAAYGGDGTVMEVAGSLLGSPIPMAILPGGTANVMALELGLPRDLAGAAQVAADPDSMVRRVDIGRAGERFFLLRVGIGFEARMVEAASREMKDKFGVLAYSLGAVQALKDSPVVRFQITLDGQTVECEGTSCLVDNAGSVGVAGLSHAQDIDVCDGVFDVIVIRDFSLSTLATAAVSMVQQAHLGDVVCQWKAHTVTIDADPPQPVQGDGELWGETPITVQVLPQAVPILVPPTAIPSS